MHVLPHPGGGGETYIDLLEEMPGYRFERGYLASAPNVRLREVGRGLAALMREARRHDLLHVHGEVAAALCMPLLAVRPSAVTLHGLHLLRRVSGARERAATLNLRATLRAADRTICVSESEHDLVVDAVGARAARRAVVIRNGVRVPSATGADERASIRTSLGISSSEAVAIWVGSLDERKDPLTAVRAAEDASMRLLVVGDGPLRKEVESAASRHVLVLGQRSDVGRLLAAADVFVLTSHREGLAFSLLEAMAHGLAPVVTDLPENLEAVGDAGLAVRVRDVPSLSSALRLAGERSARDALGSRARQRIEDHFVGDEMIARSRDIYDALLVEHGKFT